MDRTTTGIRQVPWTARMAGVVMALVGLANATFGVLSLTTDLVRLTAGAATGLLVLGIISLVAAVPVWRGSRSAVTGALTVFGLLLLVQIGDTAAASDTHSATPRLIVLGVLVAALAAARLHLGRISSG